MLRWLLTALALMIAAPTAAASFDCARARSADEVAVCTAPALSELDSALGAYWFSYSRVPMLMGGNGARHDDAEAFLRTRAACRSNRDCLTRAYRTRIAALRAGIDGAMTRVFHEENDDAPVLLAALPPPVAAIVTDFTAQCARAGGAVPPGGRPRVMTADFDGDGLPDYVVDASALQCPGAATALCANNGCQIAVAASSNRYVEALRLAGGDPAIVTRGPATELTLMVDRSHCADAVVGDACRATVTRSGGRWHTQYQRLVN